MNEKAFKKHLADLAHGHHHPEEHDWSPQSGVKVARPASRKRKAARPSARPKKRRRS